MVKPGLGVGRACWLELMTIEIFNLFVYFTYDNVS